MISARPQILSGAEPFRTVGHDGTARRTWTPGAPLARLRPPARAAYTPAMRRLVFLIALLTRFAGQEYVWRARPLQRPVPMEQPLDEAREGSRVAWWLP